MRGNGAAAAARAGALPRKRQRAKLPPHGGETPATSATYGAAPLDHSSATPQVRPRPLREPGRGRPARRAEGAPLKP